MRQPTVLVDKVSSQSYISITIVGLLKYTRKQTRISTIQTPSSQKVSKQGRTGKSSKPVKNGRARVIRFFLILMILILGFPFILKGMEYYQVWYIAPLLAQWGGSLTKDQLNLLLELAVVVLISMME